MSKQGKQKGKSKLFIIYQDFILVLCLITFLSFGLWMILNNFPTLFKGEWVVSIKDIAYPLLQLLTCVLGLLCIAHLMVLLLRFILTKGHSFIWLVGQQIIPLVFPLIVVSLIKLFSGQFDDKLDDVIVGVVSGLMSSVIVLILDRKHLLVYNILKHVAWEFVDSDGTGELAATSAPVPNNTSDSSNKFKKRKKRKK